MGACTTPKVFTAFRAGKELSKSVGSKAVGLQADPLECMRKYFN